MISIRKERPPDIAAREALLDEAFGSLRWRKSSQRLRDGRSPADGLAFVATEGKRVIHPRRAQRRPRAVACTQPAGFAAGSRRIRRITLA
jgi:predicted N-acetyltransferase YhbS